MCMAIAKQISILFVSLFIYPLCFAQTETIDSLKKVLPSLSDTARIDCMSSIAEYFDLLQYRSENSEPNSLRQSILAVSFNEGNIFFRLSMVLVCAKQATHKTCVIHINICFEGDIIFYV